MRERTVRQRIRVCLLLLLIPVLLTACSRVEFLYERSDWFMARWAASYLDLDADQRARLRGELQVYREFHRRVRAPELADFLDQLIADLEHGYRNPEQIRERGEQAGALIRDGVGDILPIVAEVLAGLDDDQIARLSRQLAEAADDQLVEFQGMSSAERRVERRERIQRQVGNWIGRLREEQEQLLAECADRLPDDDVTWIERRREQDRRLVLLLADRPGVDAVSDHLHERWLPDPESLSPDQRHARQRDLEIWVDCTHRLGLTLSDRQYQRILGRLAGYRDNLRNIAESGQ
jgi:hypothetical protein